MDNTNKTATQINFPQENVSELEQWRQSAAGPDEFIGLQLNIRCEHYRRLQAEASAQGISIGELIERMIDTWRAMARERS